MSKAVLISIRPEWCELIANGKKTIEVRKTIPKIETPFKCYIYCTKPIRFYKISECMCTSYEYLHLCEGKVTMGDGFELYDKDYQVLNGKVIGEFVCEKTTEFYPTTDLKQLNPIHFQMCEKSCVDMQELYAYANSKKLYGWHISDLVIYDKPKELSEFYRECGGIDDTGLCYECDKAVGEECDCAVHYELHLTRPPQSWCYVEEVSI